jgi:hypothetical protein
MGTAALAGYGIIILFAGSVIGWHARRAYGAHGDMKVSKARVPTFRKVRNKGILQAVVLAILLLVVIRAVAG